MPRLSKPLERAVLRRYAELAGGRDALIGWIDEALSETKPRRGRKRYGERYTIATLQQLAEAKPKDRTKIFEQLIDEGRIGGIGQRKSIVKRADRNFRKMEKQLELSFSQFKAAFDQLGNQLGQLKDSIRARIESQQRVKAKEYTRSLVTKTRGSHDDTGSGSPRTTKQARPRSRTKSTRPASSRRGRTTASCRRR
jgi:hypothetical protein